MKVGILTQPLHDNYGGLLQAYALKETLVSLGHDVIIVNRRNREQSKFRKLAGFLKKKILGQKVQENIFLKESQKAVISKNTIYFQQKYINVLSPAIYNNKQMELVNSWGFDAYIVGSDQCWRPRYSPDISTYFLSFLGEKQNEVKKVSYAASFGVSEWEFSTGDTALCKRLLSKFDGVSVREDSGVQLAREYLSRNDTIHLIDPTMLISVDHYKGITKSEGLSALSGTLKVYILDMNNDKINFVQKIEHLLGLKVFQVLPKKRLKSDSLNQQNIEEFVYPGPIQWLKGYEDAKFVITDSFHGTVFAILYNIPFIALANKRRGVARFESLLNMFGLGDRLLLDTDDFREELLSSAEIDWSSVNSILEVERRKAIEFITKSLR